MGTLRDRISLGTSPQCRGLRVLPSFALAAIDASPKLAIAAVLGLPSRFAAPRRQFPPSPTP
jgi:hypothetical protein